jgi:hypothetical protein
MGCFIGFRGFNLLGQDVEGFLEQPPNIYWLYPRVVYNLHRGVRLEQEAW